MLWFRMFDPKTEDPSKRGMHRIDPGEAKHWNEQNYGIFWAVQEFSGQERVISELTKINSWAIDIDHGSKLELLTKLGNAPLLPSRIVETKSGLHVYWFAKDAKPDTYTSIVEDRLGWLFNADPKAKDLARVLRVPGFLHCKDPDNKFLIRTLHEKNIAYSEAEMTLAFALPRKHELQVQAKQEARTHLKPAGEDFFDRLWSLSQMEVLKRLSGSQGVRGEVYTFRRVARGHYNIHVNGKDSGCFINAEGRIGSPDGGGPTAAHWLRWFGLSWKEAIRILKQNVPELGDKIEP